jgi:hypothetical protein
MEEMGSFCAEARSQCDILQAMATKMEKLYTELADYFVFDAQKYTLEEFMSDIKTFKNQFKVRMALITLLTGFSQETAKFGRTTQNLSEDKN